MSTTLKLPPPDLHEIDLEIVEVPVERLFQISRHYYLGSTRVRLHNIDYVKL